MKRTVLALLITVSLLGTLLVQPVSGAGTVTLTVSVVTESGDPVGDVSLTASWDGGSTTRTTASNGKAFVDVPDGADVTVEMAHDSYVRNHPLVVENAAEDDVTLTVYPRATATVEVADGDGPIPDASVRLVKDGRTAARGTTDADGTFQTDVIEAGEYDVRVRKAGYYQRVSTVDIENDSTVPVTIERGSVVVDFNVTDDHFDVPRPIIDATVSVSGLGSVKTLEDGENAMRLPVNTKFSVTVEKPGYRNASGTVRVEESDTRMNFTMRRSRSIALSTVSERVVAGEKLRLDVADEYGTPVGGAAILVDGESVGETNDDGVFLARLESGGSHELVAEKGSLSSSAVTVTAIDSSTPTETPAPTTESASSTPPASTGDSSGVGLPGFEFAVALLAVGLAVGIAGLRAR